METYAGIDLHSSNNFIGVINDQDKILYGKRHANRLDDVLRVLDPFKDSLKGVVVQLDPSPRTCTALLLHFQVHIVN
jgi:hypothetical protein